jgi:hypothetical protein
MDEHRRDVRAQGVAWFEDWQVEDYVAEQRAVFLVRT